MPFLVHCPIGAVHVSLGERHSEMPVLGSDDKDKCRYNLTLFLVHCPIGAVSVSPGLRYSATPGYLPPPNLIYPNGVISMRALCCGEMVSAIWLRKQYEQIGRKMIETYSNPS